MGTLAQKKRTHTDLPSYKSLPILTFLSWTLSFFFKNLVDFGKFCSFLAGFWSGTGSTLVRCYGNEGGCDLSLHIFWLKLRRQKRTHIALPELDLPFF